MMGNGILVIVVWGYSMVVVNWVVDSMAVDGVYHLLFGLFNNFGIFVSLSAILTESVFSGTPSLVIPSV